MEFKLFRAAAIIFYFSALNLYIAAMISKSTSYALIGVSFMLIGTLCLITTNFHRKGK